MTSADAEVSKITAIKENSVLIDQHGAAIEANDLASLLCRFEEATSSSDDLSIPSRTPKNIKNILLKAKSVGSSPAPTPPGTPPPTEGKVVNHSPNVPSQQTVQGAKSVPVQLKFFVNQNGSRSQIFTSSSGSKVSSLPIQITTSSGLYHSKSHTSVSQQHGSLPGSALPNKSTKLTILPNHETPRVGTKVINHSKSNETKSNASYPPKSIMTLPLPLRPTASSPPGLEKPSLSLFTPPIGDFASLQKSVPKMTVKSPTIIGVKKKTIKPATISLDTYKKRKTLSTNTNIATSKTDSVIAKSPSKQPSTFASGIPSTSKTSTPSLLQAKLESNQLAAASISLLQSMLQSKTPNKINSKVTSTQLSANLNKKGIAVKNEVKFANKIKSVPAAPANKAVSLPAVSEPIHFQNFSSQKVGSQDHDYCFLKMSTMDMIQETVRNIKEEDNITDLKIEPLKDSDYEFTKIDPHEFINFGDSSVEVEKPPKDEPSPAVDIKEEGLENTSVLVTEDLPEEIPEQVKNAEVVNDFVFEEGEFLIDEHGNDILASEECLAPEKAGVSGTTIVFKGDKCGMRGGRKYRKTNRQAVISSSPVREDVANFFDKIPSHYTALSIPAKPTKTTVFASATRAIGSTDHLELEDRTEHVDNGHFDKVPAHRRCFTNTTKEVEAPEVSTQKDVVDNGQNIQTSLSHKHSRVGSRRRQSPEQTDRQFRRSHSRSPSVPRSQDRNSRSMTRRARTISHGSGRSLSSCSTCSSSSYCSTCSGRSWSESRSRSRSWSNDRKSRSRSRSCSRLSRSSSNESRSHSAGRRRDIEMRSKRTRRQSHSENRKGNWERTNRSRSRSRSPRYRQRSHHHSGTKSRLAAGGQISQKRKEREEEKVKAMEERRVVYVGKIPEGYTKRQLHKRFESFGEIKEVKVNFREHGDNYGFVTFTYACDAIAAKERGNSIPGERKFDLCFGGRRRFCPDQYADLDGNREIEEEYAPMPTKMTDELDYAALLRQHSSAQRKHR